MPITFFSAVQATATVLSAAILMITITTHRNKNLRYYYLFCVVALCMSIGGFLEVTAVSTEAVQFAYKIDWLGLPFVGLSLFLFGQEFSGVKPKAPWLKYILWAVSLFACGSVLLFPDITVIYKSIELAADAIPPHGISTSGIFYYPVFAINVFFGLYGIIQLLRATKATSTKDRLIHTAVFSSLIILPLTGVVLGLTVLKSAYDPVPPLIGMSAFIIGIYLIGFEKISRTTVSRSDIVLEMNAGFVLLEGNRISDINPRARELVKEFADILPNTLVDSLKDIPAGIFDGTGDHVTLYPLSELTDDELNSLSPDIPLSLRVSRSFLPNGQNRRLCVILTDDSEDYLTNEKLRRAARTDSLTKMFNRGAFFEIAGRGFSLMRRRHSDGCAMMLDLDFFKNVNDAYGHRTGDTVLSMVSDTIKGSIRSIDTCGRYGGEEFAVWLPGCRLIGAMIIAEDIRKKVSELKFNDDRNFNITVSIGVADMGDSVSLTEILHRADKALYEAKRSGRNKALPFEKDERSRNI
ncbi:MAG: diguanylate cyclase [Oscillospiraceae bacterium]|jgi:diguanylate cyclase (GGDEF)-like protein|nr:diguanylate cyclase [Oscillospiraceae bacterium]